MSEQSSKGGCCSGRSNRNKSASADPLSVRSYGSRQDIFQASPTQNAAKLLEAKVVLLGDSGVGKSSIA